MEPKITSDFRYTSRFCYTGLFVSYFCQKLIRNGIQSSPGRLPIQLKSLLEASWRDLGGILGVSWLHFSSQNGPWRHLGGFLEASWGQLGPILPPKTDPKARNSNFSYNFSFFMVFGFHFRGGLNLKS